MEGFGAFPEIFFNSFKEQTQLEEAEAMVELLEAQSFIWPYEQSAAYYSSSFSDPNSSYEPMNYAMRDEILADSFFQFDSSDQFESLIFTECNSAIERPLQRKRKLQSDEHNESSKRKVQKNGRHLRRRINVKGGVNSAEEDKNVSLSLSSCGSEEDDSNDSQMCAGTELNVKGRSGRVAATESQSLYAKKRRERINERLKILQNLVPNGTKVDISTMLEEAVQYVKFLQLQIKLLSSDELWMYAPLAYNGMNIGLDLMIP